MEKSASVPATRSVVVVGICGPSGSGKSTLASYLAEQLKSPILPISADKYFKRDKPACCYGFKSKCPEMLDAVDQAACARDIEQVVERLRDAVVVPSITMQECLDRPSCVGRPLAAGTAVIFVEGFVLFAEQAILDVCDHLVWLDCDKDTCCLRRFDRQVNKPLRDEGTGKQKQRANKEQSQAALAKWNRWQEHYDHIWKHHLDYRDGFLEALSGRSSISLDCQASLEDVHRTAVRDLQVLLAAQQSVVTAISEPIELTEVQPQPLAQATFQKSRQRRWRRSDDTDPSAAHAAPSAASSSSDIPLDALAVDLFGRPVRVRWCEDAEEKLVEGLLRKAQGRSSIKVLTEDGDVVFVPASAVRSVHALDAEIAETPATASPDGRTDRRLPIGDRVLHTAARNDHRRSYIFDMETGDPDDVLTLLFLCANPSVQLRAVTITPGSEEQVSLVRWILNEVGISDVRLGAREWPANASKKGCMTGRFYGYFGRLEQGLPCEPAAQLLRECCDEGVTLVTGAALHNLGAALEIDGFRLGRWVAQGGFAGEGVVPAHLQMSKFAGKVTCPTYNFNGNCAAANSALTSPCIDRRVLVSKNVCHRAVYDEQWHEALGMALAREENAYKGKSSRCRVTSLRLLHGSMAAYLRNRGEKKLHDPLALAVALDESVCELAEVRVFQDRGGWGSRLVSGSGTWISIDYDHGKFQSVLLRD